MKYSVAASFEVPLDESLSREEWKWLVKRRANYICERCNKRKEEVARLDAHHRDHDPLNHTLMNGECLCISCHMSEHHKGKIVSEKLRKASSVTMKRLNLQSLGTAAAALKSRGTKLSQEHKDSIAAGWDKMTPETRQEMSRKLRAQANARPRSSLGTFL